MDIFINDYAVCDRGVDLEEDLKKETESVLTEIDFTELEGLVEGVGFYNEFFGSNNIKEFVSKIISGEETIDVDLYFSVILTGIKNSVGNILKPLIIILVIVLISNIFNSLKSNKISGVSEVIYFVCFALIIILISSELKVVIGLIEEVIVDIRDQMNVIFPILLSLLTAIGGVVTVNAFTPLLLLLSKIISVIFVSILLPLFTLSLILSLVGNLSESVKLVKLNLFIKSLFKWIIGVVFAVFMAFLSIKGLTAGVSDGISVKATKFVIKNYIPMLGGYISEGFELVKAVKILIKNATGVVGILLLFFNILSPVIILVIFKMGLKFLSGVVEVIGDKRASNLFLSVSESLKLLVVIVVGVALMYFLTMFLLIGSASNFI